MKHIFLSPHLDDALFSCGGLISQLVRSGDPVEVWTIFAGSPVDHDLTPFARELHVRWQTGDDPAADRRTEDLLACQAAGTIARHFTFLDCIYRHLPGTGEPVIQQNEDLFNNGPLREEDLIREIAWKINDYLTAGMWVYAPLALGNHIDHRIVRAAVEKLLIPVIFYADYPYAASVEEAQLAAAIPGSAAAKNIQYDDLDLQHWADAIAQYRSQISTFWKSHAEMLAALHRYSQTIPGSTVWWY